MNLERFAFKKISVGPSLPITDLDNDNMLARITGFEMSTPMTLRACLHGLVGLGSFFTTAADISYDQSPVHDQESRSGKFWMVSHPVAPDDSGVERLLLHWGG
ncbi:hypothetical protein [Rhizobium laguerreae]|uniref:hypothetical protein n=1 Tax=Rhizobium laguerreae TaxID=1076926 RepID=UPI001C91FB22|nr:hypothetical protein [Rhizobium laguerreae]MBY3386556.1 hypothetical protein [Rhizobium laguerreae]MBY3400639.1 hypothetical protein [Rhizobium laguerreae]MBY3407577.1 hypothetical protein [Rhizobium laguerreae]